jgi:hypothetical protein
MGARRMKNLKFLTGAAILMLLSTSIADKAQAESTQDKANDKNQKNADRRLNQKFILASNE